MLSYVRHSFTARSSRQEIRAASAKPENRHFLQTGKKSEISNFRASTAGAGKSHSIADVPITPWDSTGEIQFINVISIFQRFIKINISPGSESRERT